MPPREMRVDDVMRSLRARVRLHRAEQTKPAASAEHGSVPEPGWSFDGLGRLPRRTPLADREQLELRDFLDHHDESFVLNAYRGLLGRDPDPQGWVDYLVALRSGALTKIEILGRIKYSKEGRRRSGPVPGLLLRYATQCVYRVPVLGYLARLPVALLRLPRMAASTGRLEAYMNHRFDLLAERQNEILGQVERAIGGVERSGSERIDTLARSSASADQVRRLDALVRDTAPRALVDELRRELDEVKRRRGDNEQLELLQALVRDAAPRSKLDELSKRLQEIARHKADSDSLGELERAHAEFERRLDAIRWRQQDAELLQQLSGRVGQIAEQLCAVETRAEPSLRVPALAEEVELVKLRLDQLAESTREAAASAGTVAGLRRALTDTDARMQQLEQRLKQEQLAALEDQRRLQLLLEETRERLSEPRGASEREAMRLEDLHLGEAMYANLEDRFRGSRAEVKERLAVYLPRVVETVGSGTADAILDLGCGRGEWLELLQEQGLAGRGVDVNRAMVGRCTEAGLAVVHGDAIEFLRAQAAGSLAVVTGFQLLEHLPFQRAVTLVDESFRALRQGGLAIFETPNPENLAVGACNFYADPTHENPLYPLTLQFVLEQRGYVEVEIVRPNAPPRPDWLQPIDAGDPLAARLNPLLEALRGFFDVSPDFAVIGRKG